MPASHRSRTRQSAPHSSFRRNPESRGAGIRECSAVEDFARRGPCPPLGSGLGRAESPVRTRRKNRNSEFSCLGAPAPAGMSDWYENDVTRPRACPHSTAHLLVVPAPFVVPAPHSSFRRKPESRGAGIREYSAVEDFARRGPCPPLGSGWGVAESAAPIRRTKPQLQVFIPWCAGPCRHERLLRKHVPDSDPGWWHAASIVPRNPTNLPDRHSGPPFLIPANAGIQRGGERGM